MAFEIQAHQNNKHVHNAAATTYIINLKLQNIQFKSVRKCLHFPLSSFLKLFINYTILEYLDFLDFYLVTIL